MNCTYLGQKADFSLPQSFPSSNRRSPTFSNTFGFSFSMAQFPSHTKSKMELEIGLLNVYASQFRIQLFTTESWLPGRQWSLGINLPQELQPSSFPEQHFSTRATLATRRCSTAPEMARFSQMACGRCWCHQMAGWYPTTHRTPLLCRTVIAVG